MNIMYPSIAFSPTTILTQNIGAADTRIYIDDVSVLGNPPNLITLATAGTDEIGETVKYIGKGSNFIDVERGVEGVTQSWIAGTNIGRLFTAKDLSDIQSNVLEVNQNSINTQTDFAAHKNNVSNPHIVTAAQTGLGSVQNYGVANTSEAESGTATNKYTTPKNVFEAIAKWIATNAQAIFDSVKSKFATVASTGNYLDLAEIPPLFAPTAHANSHAKSGNDALSPASIGAYKEPLQFFNVTVNKTIWIPDATYTAYEYAAFIPLIGVIENMTPNVIFNVVEADSGSFAPIATAAIDTVIIYAKTAPVSNITIPTIICWPQSGT